MQWTRGDFGLNPEHPPLVKFLATLPLLDMNLKMPPRHLGLAVFPSELSFRSGAEESASFPQRQIFPGSSRD